jgi:hypothetical protein
MERGNLIKIHCKHVYKVRLNFTIYNYHLLKNQNFPSSLLSSDEKKRVDCLVLLWAIDS